MAFTIRYLKFSACFVCKGFDLFHHNLTGTKSRDKRVDNYRDLAPIMKSQKEKIMFIFD